MNRRHLPLVLLLVVAALTISSGCVTTLHGLLLPPEYPAIQPVPGATGIELPGYSYEFENFTVTLSTQTDPGVFAGARAADKEVKLSDHMFEDDEWRATLYRVMTTDPAQDRFFEDLCNEFREIRTRQDLDTDEYLELMTVFVQSLPYRNQNLSNPKYPLETYTDREGDCDDKSMLLARLLAHEGYGVSLFYFGPEDHMAVGVTCSEGDYRDTGYAYIETTRVSLVGTGSDFLAANFTVISDPLVIPIRNGPLGYSRAQETLTIHARVIEMGHTLDEIQKDLAEREHSLQSEQSDLDEMEREIAHLRLSGDSSGQERLVSAYNQKALSHNRDLERYHEILEEYTSLAAHYNYLISHEHDRVGISSLLSGENSTRFTT